VRKNGPVIVIGTGPAGAAATVFLSRAGIDTLVLETGFDTEKLGFIGRVRGLTLLRKRPPLKERTDLTMVGDPSAQLYEALSPGGLSNQWSCAVPRFSEDDFADAARAGEEQTWPIGYADLAPWYDRVEPLLRIAGSYADAPQLPAGRARRRRTLAPDWEPVVHEAARRGRSAVVMPYAYGAETTFTASGTVFNAFTRLVKPAVRSGAVAIRFGMEALRLEWSESERRVVAVICHDRRTGNDERVPCRAVIVAGGAVNSAQILLQSKSGDFPDGLGNEHGVLGRYLHDHPLGKIVIDLDRPVSAEPASYVTRPLLDRSAPLYAAAYMQWSGTEILAKGVLAGHPGRTARIGFTVFGTMVPSRTDFVALDAARPWVKGRSALLFSLRYPPEAKETLERAKVEILEILERAGWNPRLHVWRVEVPGNSVHYGGTCRMHASPKYGVVDRFCRVHGVKNVVVADSSVFTTGPEKNPVLTAMSLAARAADRLGEELRDGDL